MMRAKFCCILLLLSVVGVAAQKPRHFPRQVPPGNYSGIAAIGDDRFAVVSDKSVGDGFFVFRIVIDSVKGRVQSVVNEGFRSSGLPNRDMEGVAYCPATQTLFVSGEKDNEILEYALDGRPTGRRLPMPEVFKKAKRNCGLESLTFGHGLFYTTTERPIPGDTLLRIQTFDTLLQAGRQYLYRPDGRELKNGYWGVSELCALADGRLLVLEREIRVPRLKVGARTLIKIYETTPGDSAFLQKRLLRRFTTRLTLRSRRFANYEGMCEVQPGQLLLVADSQNRYRGLLRDWFLLLGGL